MTTTYSYLFTTYLGYCCFKRPMGCIQNSTSVRERTFLSGASAAASAVLLRIPAYNNLASEAAKAILGAKAGLSGAREEGNHSIIVDPTVAADLFIVTPRSGIRAETKQVYIDRTCCSLLRVAQVRRVPGDSSTAAQTPTHLILRRPLWLKKPESMSAWSSLASFFFISKLATTGYRRSAPTVLRARPSKAQRQAGHSTTPASQLVPVGIRRRCTLVTCQ